MDAYESQNMVSKPQTPVRFQRLVNEMVDERMYWLTEVCGTETGKA